MKKVLIVILTLYAFVCTNVVHSETLYVQDRYGNIINVVKKNGQTYNEYDRYGRLEKTYKKSGNITYIYDRNGRYVGSFKKGMWSEK